MTIIAIMSAAALVLTLVAFIVDVGDNGKTHRIHAALLHTAAMPFWLVLGYFWHNATFPGGNTFFPTAVVLLAIVVTVVHLAALITTLLQIYEELTSKRLSAYDKERNRISAEIRRRVGD